MEERQRLVAGLRLRRLSMRQIVAALDKAGHKNPKTGQPWSLAIIQRDLKRLSEEAKRNALRDISEHKAEILAEYEELLRRAWSREDYVEVRRILSEVRALLGTDAPLLVIWEQVTAQMEDAVARIEEEFADDPATRDRVLAALMGGGNSPTRRTQS